MRPQRGKVRGECAGEVAVDLWAKSWEGNRSLQTVEKVFGQTQHEQNQGGMDNAH